MHYFVCVECFMLCRVFFVIRALRFWRATTRRKYNNNKVFCFESKFEHDSSVYLQSQNRLECYCLENTEVRSVYLRPPQRAPQGPVCFSDGAWKFSTRGVLIGSEESIHDCCWIRTWNVPALCSQSKQCLSDRLNLKNGLPLFFLYSVRRLKRADNTASVCCEFVYLIYRVVY